MDLRSQGNGHQLIAGLTLSVIVTVEVPVVTSPHRSWTVNTISTLVSVSAVMVPVVMIPEKSVGELQCTPDCGPYSLQMLSYGMLHSQWDNYSALLIMFHNLLNYFLIACYIVSGGITMHFELCAIPLTFSFTRYSKNIQTIIDRYTNAIQYTYDSDIQYDIDWDYTVCEIR